MYRHTGPDWRLAVKEVKALTACVNACVTSVIYMRPGLTARCPPRHAGSSNARSRGTSMTGGSCGHGSFLTAHSLDCPRLMCFGKARYHYAFSSCSCTSYAPCRSGSGAAGQTQRRLRFCSANSQHGSSRKLARPVGASWRRLRFKHQTPAGVWSECRQQRASTHLDSASPVHHRAVASLLDQ